MLPPNAVEVCGEANDGVAPNAVGALVTVGCCPKLKLGFELPNIIN